MYTCAASCCNRSVRSCRGRHDRVRLLRVWLPSGGMVSDTDASPAPQDHCRIAEEGSGIAGMAWAFVDPYEGVFIDRSSRAEAGGGVVWRRDDASGRELLWGRGETFPQPPTSIHLHPPSSNLLTTYLCHVHETTVYSPFSRRVVSQDTATDTPMVTGMLSHDPWL
ncbi:uncharacterized protein K452DRAFT_313885 [Aplosporella prunicola CBS 121167]|uniref:Uncharacterized protein n=1 Tax=Aplosporella prunicola CBS 121167 TaxID=1176127 RepID=A0A6A6AVG2_9PEZI|nr:uncharacterized protein K452DRAFT_313885 [Aplosporella prunicola CBS 121167]KAF2135576.1 hypothetical protein K452DRAFT_313885 [Aplosporella prunicola CBS 121167]